jgi:hypothetical protein
MALAARAPLFVHSSPFNTHLAAGPLELIWPWSAPATESPQWGFRGAYLCALPLLLSAWAVLRSTPEQRRPLLPWLTGAALFAVLALGPYAEIGRTRVPLPGWALAGLPGFSSLTNPWRFTLPAGLCLALPAAAGAAILLRATGSWLAPGLAFLHLIDVGNAPPFPTSMALWVDEPAPIAVALADGERYGVLDLSRHPKRNQRSHGKPIVSAWLPRVARDSADASAQLVARVRAAEPGERADLLGELGIGALISDDTRGWRIVPDPARPGHYREDPIALRDASGE